MSSSGNGETSEAAAPATRPDQPCYMGLDVGDRRIGVAISDPLGLTAQPIMTLVRSRLREDLRSLERLLRRHKCTAIVIGNPLYMSGDLSPQAEKTQSFARALGEQTGLPIHLWDERLTTTEAHRHLDSAGHPGANRRAVIDQVAAVLILQAYLDYLHARAPLPDPVD